MIERRPDYYTKFRCLGGACPDTCCRDWSVVPDEAALADYACAPSPLRERIAQNLVTDEDGDVCFRLNEQGMCTLLTPDGLCPIQRDWGEEHLCAHCAAYPRFTEEYGCLTESSLAVSCPEAARLLLEAPRFALMETDDGNADPPFDGVDPDLLAGLEHSRAQVLALLGGVGGLWNKFRSILAYAEALQSCIDAGEYGKMTACALTLALPEDNPQRQTSAVWLLNALATLDPLRPDWPALLKDRAQRLSRLSPAEYIRLCVDYARANPGCERQFTNLACYFVFRHWHKAVNDDMLYGRAAFACAAVAALYHLTLFQPGEEATLWSRFSREVEHDENNLDELIWALSDPDRASLTTLF
ncbi:MAG: flagellin lysine-N-methylase [Oscillospiraceae bacterium]|nr:flagellin lysine-N-methylase [Oscillospiraceae bacterium]MDE7171753.1 flagellin lysine-N-methylase [Oscillospiraceae bacterium]